jgi:GAF domain-containing protein
MMDNGSATAASQFAALARELAEQPDPAATAQRVVDLAAKVLGCAASVVKIDGRDRLTIVASSDPELAAHAARFAEETRQSVSRQVLEERSVVLANDLATDTRWGSYPGRLVAQTPIRSAMGFFLGLDQLDLGAMTLFADRTGFFDTEVQDRAAIFADHAAIALARSVDHAEAEHLRVALASSREIGIALGIVMATHRVTEQQSFDMLRVASQHLHRKLRDVAAELVLTGEVPTWVVRTG